MTASEIIAEIKRLHRKEQLGVIRFAYQLDAKRRLTGKELAQLAERMVHATDAAEEALIREAMIRGFHSASARRAKPSARNKRGIAKRRRSKRSAKRL